MNTKLTYIVGDRVHKKTLPSRADARLFLPFLYVNGTVTKLPPYPTHYLYIEWDDKPGEVAFERTDMLFPGECEE